MKKKIILIVFTALLTISSVILLPTITSAPGGNHPSPRTIEIGVVVPNWLAVDVYEHLLNGLIGPEINEYLEQLPGMEPPLQVDFLVVGPDEDEEWYTPERHLDEIQALAETGVEFFIAGDWSSQFGGALEYVDLNDLIMVSSSSTSPSLAFVDNGFRLAPPDTNQAEVINQMLLTYEDGEGIDALVVILRDDVWANGLVAALGDLYGGEIVEIPYSLDPDDPLSPFYTVGPEPVETPDFILQLELAEFAAEDLLSDGASVGVLMLAFEEAIHILQQAPGYDIYDLPWFGAEAAGQDTNILYNAGVEACHVHLVSALGAAPASVKYNYLADRWPEFGHGEAGFYTATLADSAWLIVNSYLDMKASTNAPFTGGDMATIFSDTAYGYYGYSGWTLLDENGDRWTIDYDIWGFGPDSDGYPSIINYGRFDSISGQLTWGYEPRPWEAGDATSP